MGASCHSQEFARMADVIESEPELGRKMTGELSGTGNQQKKTWCFIKWSVNYQSLYVIINLGYLS
jgi:hypothetical protein